MINKVRAKLKAGIVTLFTKKKYRRLQRMLGIRRIHHPRWSYGWAFPVRHWTYFEPMKIKHYLVGYVEWKPGHWKQCHPSTYHDCTTTGTY